MTCRREITPRLGNVRSGHRACAYCAGLAVHPGEAAEAMRDAGLEPLGPYPGVHRPWPCRCMICGRESSPWYSTVRKGGGCRYCGHRRTGEALRLDPAEALAVMRGRSLEPLEPYPGAASPWRCRCLQCDAEVVPRYADVASGHGGCKWCGWKRGAAKQRLSHEAAVLVMIEHHLEPLEPYPGSAVRWRCRCMRCGAEVTPRLGNIGEGRGGCRGCGRAAAADKQRGSAAGAVRDMRAAGLEPLEPYRGAMAAWPCQCRGCGREVAPRLNNIRRGWGGCAWCARCKVDPLDAARVMRDALLVPLTGYPGSGVPWPSRCMRCGEVVSPRYGAVRYGAGCRHCNDTAIRPDAAAALMRRAGLNPLAAYPGALRPWPCRCATCDRIVRPCYSTIQQGGGGCRWCATSGFNPSEPAVVYVITHAGHGAAKIGIANAGSGRISQHARHGWRALAVVPVPGDLAVAIEKDILDWWRAGLALPAPLGRLEMPQGGWTETVDSAEIDLAATLRRISDLASGDAPGL